MLYKEYGAVMEILHCVQNDRFYSCLPLRREVAKPKVLTEGEKTILIRPRYLD